MESSVRRVLNRMGRLAKGTFERKPDLDFEHMSGNDVFTITKMKGFIDSVTSKAIVGEREEALKALTSYLASDYAQFMQDSKQRMEEKEGSARASVYMMGLVVLKLASYLMSQTAEDIYQRYFRGLEQEPSVHVLPWPEPVMKLMT